MSVVTTVFSPSRRKCKKSGQSEARWAILGFCSSRAYKISTPSQCKMDKLPNRQWHPPNFLHRVFCGSQNPPNFLHLSPQFLTSKADFPPNFLPLCTQFLTSRGCFNSYYKGLRPMNIEKKKKKKNTRARPAHRIGRSAMWISRDLLRM